MLHVRIKYIKLNIHFVVWEMVVAKKLQIQHVPTTAQITDTRTKFLGSAQFRDMRFKLKVQSEAHSP